MEDRICIDTDIIIDHLKGKGPGVNIFERIIRNALPVTTQINRFELLCGALLKNEIDIINQTLSGFVIMSFDGAGVAQAAKIYRELRGGGQLIGMKDIMVAGIVSVNNVLFATKNKKDFEKIKGIRFFI
ncbi:MAG: type II toxin-antitoxin system VapC family toxin [Nitrospirota bacterium]